MSRYKYHRKDGNHRAIQEELEARGFLFLDCSSTSLGLDAIVAKHGRFIPLEIKDGSLAPSRRQLTPHERDVHARLLAHGVRVELITCSADLEVLGREQRNSYPA